jgi:hypothetical protein
VKFCIIERQLLQEIQDVFNHDIRFQDKVNGPYVASETRSAAHLRIKHNGGNKLSGPRNVLYGVEWGIHCDMIFREINDLHCMTVHP